MSYNFIASDGRAKSRAVPQSALPCDFYITVHFISHLCWRQGCLKFRNVPLFIALVVLWGSNYSVMKVALGFASPSTFLFQQFVISAVVLIPVFLLLWEKFPRDIRTVGGLAVYGLIYTAVNVGQDFGLAGEGSGLSAVIIYTQPLFVLCLAAPFLKEKITDTKILGAVMGFTGVAILFLSKAGSFSLGSGLILFLTAFLWGVSVIYYKKFLCHADPFIAVFLQMVIGTVLLAALDWGMSGLTFPVNTQYVILILYSAAGALALGNVLWLRLLSDEEATTLSSSALLVPAVALLFGWLFLNENFNIESLMGSALTLAGVYLANRAANHSCPNPQST
jgi:drug/metabolite transporter (DMT)-like permease